MRRILIIMGRYLPGYKDGGPVRSMKNLTDRLGSEYDFRILTCDRDHGDTMPYEGIRYGEWNTVGSAKVRYVQPGWFSKSAVLEAADKADLIYVCGCFNDYARTVLFLKKSGKLKQPVIVASMGLFSPGSFHLHYAKKKMYMTVLKALGWFRNIEWSATSEKEASDIRREAGHKAICHIAQDLPRKPEKIDLNPVEPGVLRVVFLSRISRSKNLSMAVKVLLRWSETCRENPEGARRILFDIYGNIEDAAYWEECKELLDKLPGDIVWNYCKEAEAEKVPEVFSGYDVFLFPTIGENYGHVIYEAMTGGCIPLISDQTPWTVDQLGNIGCILSIDDKDGFAKTLDQFARLNDEELEGLRRGCMEAAVSYSPEEAEDSYRAMFG